jgi:hypothetical protein
VKDRHVELAKEKQAELLSKFRSAAPPTPRAEMLVAA